MNQNFELHQNVANLSTGVQLPFTTHLFTTERPFHLVIAHGLGSRNPKDRSHLTDNWVKLLVKTFNSIQYSSTFYTARGHGNSTGWQETALSNLDQFKWQSLSNDFAEMSKYNYPNQSFIACGNSMGSATALWTAINFPEQVKGLILIRLPTAWKERKLRTKHLMRSAERLKLQEETENSNDLPVYHHVLTGASTSDLPEINSELLASSSRIDPSPPLTFLEEQSTASSLIIPSHSENHVERDLYDRIRCPVLLLSIEGDEVHPLSTALQVHQRLMNNPQLSIPLSLPSDSNQSLSSSSFLSPIQCTQSTSSLPNSSIQEHQPIESSHISPPPSPPSPPIVDSIHLSTPFPFPFPLPPSSLFIARNESEASRDWPDIIRGFVLKLDRQLQ